MDLGSLAPKIIDATSGFASKIAPENIAWPITDRIKAFFKNRFGSTRRMPMLEVIELATSKFGWRINNKSLDILDLANGIRQAAIDGDIKLYGRLSKNCNFGTLLDHYPIVAIQSEHLKENDIDVITFQRRDNVSMRTYLPGQSGGECFYDLHLDRRQTLYWLRTTGLEWRGRSDRRKAAPFGRSN